MRPSRPGARIGSRGPAGLVLALAMLALAGGASPSQAAKSTVRPIPLPVPRPADLTPDADEPERAPPNAERPKVTASLPPRAPLPPFDPRRLDIPDPSPVPSPLPSHAPSPFPSPDRPYEPSPEFRNAPAPNLSPEFETPTLKVQPPKASQDACARVVEGGMAVAQRLKPIGNGGCSVASAVELRAVMIEKGRKVVLDPPAVLACPMAEEVVDYVRSDLVAAAAAADGTLARILVAASYDCRGRNRIAGTKLSEHAKGNALDVRALVFADGRSVSVGAGMNARLAVTWRAAACERFSTILGPGSDGYHEDHIHVDLAYRRTGLKLCRWALGSGSARASRATVEPEGVGKALRRLFERGRESEPGDEPATQEAPASR